MNHQAFVIWCRIVVAPSTTSICIMRTPSQEKGGYDHSEEGDRLLFIGDIYRQSVHF